MAFENDNKLQECRRFYQNSSRIRKHKHKSHIKKPILANPSKLYYIERAFRISYTRPNYPRDNDTYNTKKKSRK